jgi:hypothetical protein
MTNGPEPITLEWSIRVCPVCGRDDRYRDMKDNHYFKGHRCDGKPVTVVARGELRG